MRKLTSRFTLGLGLGFWPRDRRHNVRLRSLTRLAGDGDGQGIDRESADDEGDEKHLGEHDDRGCRKKEQITTAPGLEL